MTNSNLRAELGRILYCFGNEAYMLGKTGELMTNDDAYLPEVKDQILKLIDKYIDECKPEYKRDLMEEDSDLNLGRKLAYNAAIDQYTEALKSNLNKDSK